jgi:hypothetical protein
MVNDPFAGGSHLPDITMVTALDGAYACTRAHHSDVGGIAPGSMPATSTSIWQEGVIIPPVRLTDEVLAVLLANVRTPELRRGDLAAQAAANRVAGERLGELRFPRPPLNLLGFESAVGLHADHVIGPPLPEHRNRGRAPIERVNEGDHRDDREWCRHMRMKDGDLGDHCCEPGDREHLPLYTVPIWDDRRTKPREVCFVSLSELHLQQMSDAHPDDQDDEEEMRHGTSARSKRDATRRPKRFATPRCVSLRPKCR